MLTTESKIRVLENFYGIDYALFGKSINKVESCCPLVKEEYLTIKGALVSTYIEMLRLIEHSPKPLKEKVSGKALIEMARTSAAIARKNVEKIVKTEQSRKDILSFIKEEMGSGDNIDVPKLVETKIREKAFNLAIDNLLLARSFQEAKKLNELNEWAGKIVEDSYKVLRDNLVEAAMLILYDETD